MIHRLVSPFLAFKKLRETIARIHVPGVGLNTSTVGPHPLIEGIRILEKCLGYGIYFLDMTPVLSIRFFDDLNDPLLRTSIHTSEKRLIFRGSL
ncbi:MAG: hypothetical protein MOGMAGMI_00097 [Candidatus Omnitrophica bacterium]|nr:hypothetical protein [Candidatus Omnitrophota bacterium]